MFGMLMRAVGTAKPNNEVNINIGFWKFAPLIIFIVLLVIWIVIVKLIQKFNNKTSNTEKDFDNEEHK